MKPLRQLSRSGPGGIWPPWAISGQEPDLWRDLASGFFGGEVSSLSPPFSRLHFINPVIAVCTCRKWYFIGILGAVPSVLLP